MFNSRNQKKVTYLIGGIYFVLLIWLILFKFNTNLRELGHIRTLNFIPFKKSMFVNGRLEVNEIIFNILVFVPLGVYVGALKSNWSFMKKILPGFFISIIFEILQFTFALGACDITDVIDNTLGGIIGILLFFIFKNVFKKQYLNIINSIGLIIEILAITMLGLLLVSNM